MPNSQGNISCTVHPCQGPLSSVKEYVDDAGTTALPEIKPADRAAGDRDEPCFWVLVWLLAGPCNNNRWQISGCFTVISRSPTRLLTQSHLGLVSIRNFTLCSHAYLNQGSSNVNSTAEWSISTWRLSLVSRQLPVASSMIVDQNVSNPSVFRSASALNASIVREIRPAMSPSSSSPR